MPLKRLTDTKGFTIIEVLIVLAIAGLILMMVFEALPALERNGRNDRRKQDVSALLESVSHYELSDSGNFPDSCGASTQPACDSAEGGSHPNDYLLSSQRVNLSYYDPTQPDQIVIAANSPGQAVASPTSLDEVIIYNYEKCSSTNPGAADSSGAGYNDVIALYTIETSSPTPSPQCQQL